MNKVQTARGLLPKKSVRGPNPYEKIEFYNGLA